MMNSTWMNWTLAAAISAGTLGCATTNKSITSQWAAEKSSTASTEIVSQEPQSSSSTSASSSSSALRFASAQQPMHDIKHDPQHPAGNEFQQPPAVPAEPPEVLLNQTQALQGHPLTLDMLQELACQNNPTLLQARSQVQGELGKAIQAGLWPNPTFSYVQEQIGVAGTPGEFVGGTVSQRIVTGHKLDLSRAKFMARTQAAEWHALEQQYRVLNDVRIHYFRARGQHELVLIHRDLLRTAEDNVLTTREQYNVGQATLAQVRLANVALQRARLDLLKVENEFRDAYETLTALVGVDLPLAELATPLEGDMTPIAWDEALTRLHAESPQLQAARNKLESDRITIRREIVEPVPDLVVEGGAGYNFDAEETVASARISAQIPLYDWNQGTIRQAEADYARQQGEVRRLELVLKRELANTYRTYLTSMQHASNYRDVILPEARMAYELQLRSYRDNRITWPEVLHTQQDYFTLRAEYIRNLTMWRESEVLIEGYLLHGGLMAPTAPPPPGHINAVPKPR